MYKTCEQCGNTYEKQYTRSVRSFVHHSKYCSLPCAYRGQARNRTGGKRTVETRKKMSVSRRKWKLTKEQLRKMSKLSTERMLGKKLSEETRLKLKRAQKKRVEEGRHNNYKGGVSTLREQIRHDSKNQQWILDVLERDKFCCVKCGVSNSGKMVADHKKLFSVILNEYKIKTLDEAMECKELWNLENGQTLCRPCHNEKTKKDRYIWLQLKETVRLNFSQKKVEFSI